MFALDLFNTPYERALTEGAVDNLEARYIHGLNMKMLDLLDRAHGANPEMKAALKREFQKVKAERDEFFKINPKTGMTDDGMLGTTKGKLDELGYGGLTHESEAGIPGNVPTEKIPGKEDLLKGKGRSYYEGADDLEDRGEYDREGDMAKDNIHTIVRNAKELESILGDNDNLPEWVQDKLANIKGMMTAVSDYMQTQHERDHEEATGEEDVTIAEKLKGLPSKKLGSARDLGKSIKKFRQQRGLAEVQKKNPEKTLDTVDESHMSELDAMRQDLERMNDRQFLSAYGISKQAFQQKYRSLLQPTPKQDIPVKEHGGGIGPKKHWQSMMPEQSNPEEDDWYDDESETELRSGDYVRDTMDGEHGEIFRMQGDPYERRVRILDRDGKGWYIEPSRLTRVDPTDPDVQRYFGKRRQRDMDEGWSDAIVAQRTGRPRTPYSVYIKGKKWKDFENEDHAENVANKLRAKFKADGRDPSVITIAPTDYDKGMREEAEGRVDPILIKALNRMPDGLADHHSVLDAAYDAYAMELGKMKMKSDYGVTQAYIPQLMDLYKKKHGLTFKEAANPAQQAAIAIAMKKAGKKPEQVDEESSTGSEAVERAVLNRIMVAHTDLLMKFGPEKVMQAVEEVAYNVGDIDEIGTSDVSGWVNQVRQILGVE